MIIVAGQLRVAPADRAALLDSSHHAVRLARSAPGCHDFYVVADPLDADRVNVYERWADLTSLDAFRGDGPDDELSASILSSSIDEFEVSPARHPPLAGCGETEASARRAQ